MNHNIFIQYLDKDGSSTLTPLDSATCPAPLLFVESGGHEETNGQSHGYFNRPEGLRIMAALRHLLRSGLDPDDIGIVRMFSS